MLRISALLVFVLGGLGCSKGSGGGSGVDGDTKAADLTTEQATDVCDYTAQLFGGYGAQATCGNSQVFIRSREACIADLGRYLDSCPVTVAQIEACAEAVGTNLCMLSTEPACAYIKQCSF